MPSFLRRLFCCGSSDLEPERKPTTVYNPPEDVETIVVHPKVSTPAPRTYAPVRRVSLAPTTTTTISEIDSIQVHTPQQTPRPSKSAVNDRPRNFSNNLIYSTTSTPAPRYAPAPTPPPVPTPAPAYTEIDSIQTYPPPQSSTPITSSVTIPTFPLHPPPSCRRCGTTPQFRKTVKTYDNGNYGRPYYLCDNGHGWITWDDEIGVDMQNPLCYCNMPSREDRRTKGPQRGQYFNTCAVGSCSY